MLAKHFFFLTAISFLIGSFAQARSPKTMQFIDHLGNLETVQINEKIDMNSFEFAVQGDCLHKEKLTPNSKNAYIKHPEYALQTDEPIMIGGVPFYHAGGFFTGVSDSTHTTYYYSHILEFDSRNECKKMENPRRMFLGYNAKPGWAGAPHLYIGWERDTDAAYLYPSGFMYDNHHDGLNGRVTEWYQ